MVNKANKKHFIGLGLMAAAILIMAPVVCLEYEYLMFGQPGVWITVPLIFILFAAGTVFFLRGGALKPVEVEALAIMWCAALAVFIFAGPYAIKRYHARDYHTAILSASLVAMAASYIVINTVNFIRAACKKEID